MSHSIPSTDSFNCSFNRFHFLSPFSSLPVFISLILALFWAMMLPYIFIKWPFIIFQTNSNFSKLIFTNFHAFRPLNSSFNLFFITFARPPLKIPHNGHTFRHFIFIFNSLIFIFHSLLNSIFKFIDKVELSNFIFIVFSFQILLCSCHFFIFPLNITFLFYSFIL